MKNELTGYIIISTANYHFDNAGTFQQHEGYFFKVKSKQALLSRHEFHQLLATHSLDINDLIPCTAIKVGDRYLCYSSDEGYKLAEIHEDNFHLFAYNNSDTAGTDMKKGYLLIRVGRKMLNGLAYQENKIFFIQTDELNITDNLLSYINANVCDNNANPLYIQKSLIPCIAKISHNANGIYYFYDIQTGQEIAYYQGVNVHVLQYKG